MPTFVICAMMLVTAIFLPWVTANIPGGMNIALATGTSDWGMLSTIAGILGIALAFITTAKVRSLGLIVASVLVIVGAIIYITRLSGATLGFGLIIEILLALAAIYIGFTDYNKSNPPAPPPPPPK